MHDDRLHPRKEKLHGKNLTAAGSRFSTLAIYEGRRTAPTEDNRFADLFRAFAAKGIHAEPAVYHDDFCAEVREQLMHLDGVLNGLIPFNTETINQPAIVGKQLHALKRSRPFFGKSAEYDLKEAIDKYKTDNSC